MSVLTAIIIALLLAAGTIIVLFNSIIHLRNKADEAWADIDTQLKRRYDLIPNLVETVKGYAGHESATLEKVTQARTMALSAQSVQQKQEAENMLSGALKSIFALSENYPDLKANQNFLQLQTTLNEIEQHLQMSRRYYNATIRDFNTKIQVFPNNLLAGMMGFAAREFFEAKENEKENVNVSFADNKAASQISTNTPQEQATAPTPTPTPVTEPMATPTPVAVAPAMPEAPSTEPVMPPAMPETPAAPEAPAAPETPAAPEAPQNPPQNPQS